MGIRGALKASLLGMLREQIRSDTQAQIDSGDVKLEKINLDDACDRIIPALKGNPGTAIAMKTAGITDEDLRNVLTGVLEDLREPK